MQAAAEADSAGACLRTPVAARSDALSRATGAEIVLKLDNLQATGAFKERGAANRLALLSPAERAAASSPCPPAITPRRWRGTPICSASTP